MNWNDHISINPKVCNGRPCIKGTRVMVSVLLDNLAGGESMENVSRSFHVTEKDIQAALHFAGELARERYLPLQLANA